MSSSIKKTKHHSSEQASHAEQALHEGFEECPTATSCFYCKQFVRQQDLHTLVLVIGTRKQDCEDLEETMHATGLCRYVMFTTRPFSDCVQWMRSQSCNSFLVIRAPVQFSKEWQGWNQIQSIMQEKEDVYLLHYIALIGFPNGSGSHVFAYDSRAFFIRKSYLDQTDRIFDSSNWLIWDYCRKYGGARASYPQLVYNHVDDQLVNDPFVQNIMTLVTMIFLPIVLFMIFILLTSSVLRSKLFRLLFVLITIVYVLHLAWNMYWVDSKAAFYSASKARSEHSSNCQDADASKPSAVRSAARSSEDEDEETLHGPAIIVQAGDG